LANLIETPRHEREAEDAAPRGAIARAVNLPRESNLGRFIRLAIAIPLIAVSFAALFPFAALPVSNQAVVNARLSEVRAPLEGELGAVSLETGDVVTTDQALAQLHVSDPTFRTAARDDLRSQGDIEQEASRVGAALAASQLEMRRYDGMYRQYLQHYTTDLDSQIRDAERDLAGSQRKAAAANDELKRVQQGLAAHLVAKPAVDEANDRAEVAQRDADAKSAQVRKLRQQLTDARAGYVLDPSSSPAFLSERDHAAADVDRLREEKSALDTRLNQAKLSNAASKQLPVTETTVVSPVSGTIWSRAVATGQTVQSGDELFHIADANSIHVEVWLDRRYGPQLSIGDTALVYLSGLGKELAGKVTSFEGTSRRRGDEEVNAIDLQPVHPDQYHVSIELDPKDRKAIYIGQSAKVLFPGSRHRLRAQAYFWLTRL
jgi:multidrug resistance efflux pump